MKFKQFEPKRIEVVDTTDPELTKINRKKAAAIKARIAQFFHPITKHFSNKIEFIMDEIGEMPEMENLPKGNTKDFTSKIGYALSLGLKEKEIFFFGLMQWIFVLLAYILWLQMLSSKSFSWRFFICFKMELWIFKIFFSIRFSPFFWKNI